MGDIINERVAFQSDAFQDIVDGKPFDDAVRDRKANHMTIGDALEIDVQKMISGLRNSKAGIVSNMSTLKKLSTQYKSTNVHNGLPFDIIGFEFTTDERINIDPLNTIVNQHRTFIHNRHCGNAKYIIAMNNEKDALYSVCGQILNYPHTNIKSISDFSKLAYSKFRNSEDKPKSIHIDSKYANYIANSYNKLKLYEDNADKERRYIDQAFKILEEFFMYEADMKTYKNGYSSFSDLPLSLKFDTSGVLKEDIDATKQFRQEYRIYVSHLQLLTDRLYKLYRILIYEKYTALYEQCKQYCDILRKSMKSK